MPNKYTVLSVTEPVSRKVRYYVGKKWFSFFGKSFYSATSDYWYDKEKTEEIVMLLNNPEELDKRIHSALEEIKERRNVN